MVREQPRGAVGASRTAALLQGPVVRSYVIALCAAVLLASAGAFGSNVAPIGPRTVYWIVLMVGGTGFAHVLTRLTSRSAWLEMRPVTHAAAVTLGMSIPYSVVVWAVSRALWPQGSAPSLAWQFPPVLMISAAMTAVNMLASRAPLETHAAAPGGPAPRFLDRLPAKLKGADLYAVQAEDHYLRLHTSRGEDLILMRLSDAVSELEGLEGAQTHRSWWVAKSAVAAARRADGRAVLVLTSGAEAPVSRSYVKTLREEGWFDR